MHVTLQVWDIGGQTLGGKMLENYIYGAKVSSFSFHLKTARTSRNWVPRLVLIVDTETILKTYNSANFMYFAVYRAYSLCMI